MTRVNHALVSRGVDSRYATVFFGVITQAGRLTYCNAGHNPPLLFHGSEVARLETGGTIVGLFPHATYEQETRQLSAGDLLTLFSDGVSEAFSTTGEEFGENRICEAVREARDRSAAAALQALMTSVKHFAHGAAQHDDVTAMMVQYVG
jgi:sigma-B regulation protein RsbU (phosphoserine phosphatase)